MSEGAVALFLALAAAWTPAVPVRADGALTPRVLSVAVVPATVIGGTGGAIGVVTLSGRAPAGGVVVPLRSGDPARAGVPTSVTVPAGRTRAAFTVTVPAVSAVRSVFIRAMLGNVQTATVSVRPVGVASVTFQGDGVIGGQRAVALVTLDAPAAEDLPVRLACDDSTVTLVSASGVIRTGERTCAFEAETRAVKTLKTVRITATVHGLAQGASLTIRPSQKVSAAAARP